MRIALVVNYWLKSSGGGVREYNAGLAKGLADAGHEVKVMFREGVDPANEKMPERKLDFSYAAMASLHTFKPDLVLTQGGWFAQLAALRYKGTKKTPALVNFHHTMMQSRMPFFKRIAYDNLVNRFDFNAFVCEALARNLNKVGRLQVRTKRLVLYPGVSYEAPPCEEVRAFREKHHLLDGPVILGQGLTANEGKARGAELLIDCVPSLRKKHPGVKLVLTRGGAHTKQLMAHAVKRRVEDSVVFTGDLEKPLVAVACADVFAHISFADGLPLALLEAMAAGKPIIATDDFGIPEALEDGKSGILVKNRRREVVGGIGKLLDDKSLGKSLGEQARIVAQEKFTWKHTVDKLISSVNVSTD